MADVVLKNQIGAGITYNGVDTIVIPDDQGNDVTFSSETPDMTMKKWFGGNTVTEVPLSWFEPGATSVKPHMCAFQYKLEKVNLPSTVTHINNGAFQSCDKLTDIDLTNIQYFRESSMETTGITGDLVLPNVRQIGPTAFAGCPITSIDLGTSLSSGFGKGAFSFCTNLQSVTIRYNAVVQFGENMFLYCSNLAHIYVPSNLVNNYKSATGWSDYASIISAIPS